MKLASLLFGSPLSNRNAFDDCVPGLDAALEDLIAFLKAEHASSRAFLSAEREIMEIVMLKGRENDEIVHLDAAVACKRGILLFAIWRLPEWSNSYFAGDEVVLADLQRRILPLIGPLFLANIGQRPDAFVAMVGTMHRLWTVEEFKSAQT